MRTSFVAAAILGSTAYAVEDITAIGQLIAQWDTFFTDFDFWYYFILELQFDTGADYTSCVEKFNDYRTLYNEMFVKNLNKIDYNTGINTKGNGSSTDAGFEIYKILNWIDVAIQGTEIWNGCNLENYMLAIGKSVTQVSAAFNQLTNLGFRLTSDEDKVNFKKLSDAVRDSDKVAAGEAFGKFTRLFIMVENPTADEANEYYQ